MMFLIPVLGPWLVKRCSEKVAKAASWGLIALAVILGLWWAYTAIYNDGRNDLLTEQAVAQAKADALQRDRERKADDRRREELKAGQAIDDQQRKELENATENLPDAAPGARQRSRVCIELRQQARAKGKPEPAC
ncbi:hypothetical protein FSZ31_04455 [Sphingorhabdus soli]|uniref:Uncharacterized protein n=1 Tax=Flavisphingopyxis soli TaxID=2601267 RepID=A0A5C6UM58_9SPHN|nr:hypothetical protein [Sphingorhabdus soli]TXC73979.1 hypothetical protein FSZ31_04455 [Sphingorhabdus soli]